MLNNDRFLEDSGCPKLMRDKTFYDNEMVKICPSLLFLKEKQNMTCIGICLCLIIPIVGYFLLRSFLFGVGEVKFAPVESRIAYNAGTEAAIHHARILFGLAQSEILVVSGELDPIFWDNKSLTDKLGNVLLDRGVRCIVLTGPETNLDALKELQPMMELKLLQVGFLAFKPKGHFMVVDSRHVRLEDPTQGEDSAVTARILYSVPALGHSMRKLFFTLWKMRKDTISK